MLKTIDYTIHNCIYKLRFSGRRDSDALRVIENPRGRIPTKTKEEVVAFATTSWSGRRDSDPRYLPWQGSALPLSHSRI